VIKFDNSGNQVGFLYLGFQSECQKRVRIGDDEKDQPGNRQCQDTVQAVSFSTVQYGAAADAPGRSIGGKGLKLLQQITFMTGDKRFYVIHSSETSKMSISLQINGDSRIQSTERIYLKFPPSISYNYEYSDRFTSNLSKICRIV
jgi:hypothetical protein